jgi:hypothetical protein
LEPINSSLPKTGRAAAGTQSDWVTEEQAVYGVPQQRRKTSLIVAAAAGSAAAACNEKVWLVWRWVAGRMFAAVAILTLMLTTAKSESGMRAVMAERTPNFRASLALRC